MVILRGMRITTKTTEEMEREFHCRRGDTIPVGSYFVGPMWKNCGKSGTICYVSSSGMLFRIKFDDYSNEDHWWYSSEFVNGLSPIRMKIRDNVPDDLKTALIWVYGVTFYKDNNNVVTSTGKEVAGDINKIFEEEE